MSKRLCATCNRIFTDTDFTREGRAPHHSNLDDLHQAAASGCYICRWITTSRQWSDLSYLNSHGFPIRFGVSFYADRLSDELTLGLLVVEAAYDIPDEDSRLRFDQTIADLNEMKEKWMPQTVALMIENKYCFRFNFHLRAIEEGESYIIQLERTKTEEARKKRGRNEATSLTHNVPYQCRGH